MKGSKRLLLIFTAIAGLVILFSQCMDTGKKTGGVALASDSTIAGTKTCVQCHKNIYDDYLSNVHYNTSRVVSGHSLFQGDSALSTDYNFDEHLKIKVEQRDTGLFQAVYADGEKLFDRKFDVAIGSGKNAITYGSWKKDNLQQMQLTYFSGIKSWANSPGYADKRIYFSRNISSRCLQCHASYVDEKVEKTGELIMSQHLVKTSLVYGINCERCHGPAGKHVEFHISNPNEKAAKFITLYQSITRKQKVDACSVCHSGSNRPVLKSTFGFKPGDDLDQYLDKNSMSESDPDVHGQQNQMLSASQCYVKSNSLSCNSCHSVHDAKANGLTAYSKKCMSCHATPKHSEKTLASAMVKTNCIDCHMPFQKSKVISFKLAGKQGVDPYLLRTHKIAVY
ncbi:multiheme c-type cytochrome [Pedobacter sp. PWIIR3]